MNYLRLAIAWLEVVWTAIMLVATVCRFRNVPLAATKKTAGLLAAGWILFALLHIPFKLDPMSWISTAVYIFSDWLKLGLLTPLLTATVRLLRSRKAGRP